MAIEKIQTAKGHIDLVEGLVLSSDIGLFLNTDVSQWQSFGGTGLLLGPFAGFCRVESLARIWKPRLLLHLKLRVERFAQLDSKGNRIWCTPPEGKDLRGLMVYSMDLSAIELRLLTQPAMGELATYSERMPYFE